MNQILSTSIPNYEKKPKKEKREKGPVDIKTIMMVFAIILILFGTSTIGVSAYSIVQNKKIEELSIKPSISIENKDEKTLLLKVMHQRNIENVTYYWNDDDVNTIAGNERKYIEQEITIPAGINTLHVLARDEIGQEEVLENEYEVSSDINLEVSGNKIRITYDGDKKLSYMTYRWDNEDETRINVEGGTLDEELEAQKGLHTLTVAVVDENNETDTKVQKINGVAKPKVSIKMDDTKEHFELIASDETGLDKIELKLDKDDSKKYLVRAEGKTEMDYILPLSVHDGENFVEIKIYNLDGVTSEIKAKFNK